jgi:hypothetical protein
MERYRPKKKKKVEKKKKWESIGEELDDILDSIEIPGTC